MIIRAKTTNLISTRPLTDKRRQNSELNLEELQSGATVLRSRPRRLVFELTNACNLNCIMCGRNSAHFVPTRFDTGWFERFSAIMDTIEEVTLMGWGEPTVHPDFVRMLEILDRAGVRKYFCTNGMKLGKLTEELFRHSVDVVAVSLDGVDQETNDRIRRGADFHRILGNLERIVSEKRRRGTRFPYINFVFTAMNSNIRQLPDMVRLASSIGLEEVKVVYLTVFSETLASESLFDRQELVREQFQQAERVADETGVTLKLPHFQGEDEAGTKPHKDCFTVWRDFFLGSDGYVRACMSSPVKLFHISKYDDFDSMWNSPEYQEWRSAVNSETDMHGSCRSCYQSSFANWNQEHAFLQLGHKFAPDWEK